MCGIAGIYNFDHGHTPEQGDLEKMIKMVRHRGPDDYGFHIGDNIGLAHARLSIIDLAGGHQPMHDVEKDISIVFNGEIFNYLELREMLAGRGVKFATTGDTEVIIYLYKEFGLDFVQHLNGQFAIGLWDNRKRQLILVRDRVGIDPLFYTINHNRLLFASEIKSILANPSAPSARLNLNAFDQLLTFWTPVGAETLFENISEVKPGEMLVVHNGKMERIQYWEWLYPSNEPGNYHSGSEEDLAAELHDRLIEATKIRLRSDVPVAAYLSGGLDSSVLVSLIHHYGNVPLRTFSIGFEDKALDESSYQKQLIDHIHADHSSIVCKHHDIAENFERTIWHTESTILRTAPVPMMLLSGLVHQSGYKVVLTGEGSDEVLGGYDLFKEGKIRQFWARNPTSRMRPLLLKKLYPYLDISQSNSRAYLEAFFGIGLDQPQLAHFSHLPRWDTTSKTKAFYSQDVSNTLKSSAMDAMTRSLDTRIDQWHPFNKAQYIEARLLMAKYLLSSQGDRMLMANAVEGRFPFLDHTVIEFANKLRPSLKMKVLNEKYLLKKAMMKYLPGDILRRHKQPYRAPDIPSFFYQGAPAYVDELLSPALIRQYGYFDPDKVTLLHKKIRAGKATGYKDNMALMAILSTQMWHRKFVENFKNQN
jgi:asparagine synthase (glutamine-hydrolysing)